MSIRSFIVCIMAVVTSACSREPVPAPSMSDVRAETAPTQESWNVKYHVSQTPTGSDESRPRLEVSSRYMAAFETEDSTYTVMEGDSARRVRAVIFDEIGDTSATVHANLLVMLEDDSRFEARGNVDVMTPDERSLVSEHIMWFEDERLLRTPGFVRIRTPNERIEGYQLEADEDLESFTLRRVTGQVTVEDDE